MAERIYQAFFFHDLASSPEDGTVLTECKSTVEISDVDIKLRVLDIGIKNLVDGSILVDANISVVELTGFFLESVNAKKPFGPLKFDQTVETWAEHKAKIEVFNPEIYIPVT